MLAVMFEHIMPQPCWHKFTALNSLSQQGYYSDYAALAQHYKNQNLFLHDNAV